MKIGCAENSDLAKELVSFLQEKGNSVSQKESLVTTKEKVPLDILELFINKTDRSKHKITFVDTDIYLIAIPMDLEDIEVHRRSHQAL